MDILVVGHHGSSTSTTAELLHTVSPEVAIISVGHNSYGHPSDRVLELLEALGCSVLRTDISGNIIIKENADG